MIPAGDDCLSFLMGAPAVADAQLTAIGATLIGRTASGARRLRVPGASLAAYRELVAAKLEPGYWNEWVGRDAIGFVFKLADGTVRELTYGPGTRAEIARLCSQLNGDPIERTADVLRYLAGNDLYREVLVSHHGVAGPGADGYEIRRATAADIPAFIEMRRRMFAEVGFGDLSGVDAVSQDYFARAIPAGDFVAFVAVAADGRVVGSAGLSTYRMPPKPKEPGGRFGYVSSMYVMPAHRRRRLAHQMMDAVIACASDLGLTWLTLHASAMGRPLYEAIGFEAWNEMGLHLPSARRRDSQ